MPDHVVTDEKGQKHRFPDEATPEMIAEALGIQPPSQGPNLKTGEGMEAQSQQQAGQYLQGRATAPYEQQQAELQQRKNRAVKWQMNNPAAVTNAVAAYAPMAAAKSIAGAKVGGYAGRKAADAAGIPPEYGELAGGTLGGFAGAVPWNRASLGKTVINPRTLEPRPGIKLIPWMNNERATALGDLLDPNLPKVRNMLQATEESMPNRINELAAQGKQETLFGQENAAAIKRAQAPEPLPWQAPSHDVIKPGTPEFADAAYGKGNQYPWSRVPSRAPVAARNVDPFSGEPTAQAKPQADQPIETFPEPNPAVSADRPGSLWSVPREQLETRATRGQPGALDVLKNVRKEPFLVQPRPSMGEPNPEFNALRESNMPQGNPTPFQQPIQVQKDSMGIRWAHDGTNRVSIPQSVPDEAIADYARPKLAEQATIRSQLPWMKGSQ